MKKYWIAAVTSLFALFSWSASANCNEGDFDSAEACAGRSKCVEIKVKHYCDNNGQLKKQYYVEPSEDTVEIQDRSDDAVLILGDLKWAFELTFYDAGNSDVTQALKRSGNLSKDCERGQCQWKLAGGGLTKDQAEITLKYTISKKAQVADNIDPLDPSVIVKK